MNDEPVYALEPGLSAVEFVDVLQRSTLAERRPIDDLPRMDQMLRQAQVIVTARIEGRLVGISRALSDFCYATYLADLAVDRECQGRGIGKRLIEETHRAAGKQTMIILIAAPGARTYYPHVGLEPHDSCWIVHRDG
ncbi:Acetyltransferase (GNAT) family protein [Caulifigura coniformis]|uniref:Acetyltransferase (GNAT) family protein n=1 Tax=Caulifigura coniformis TaxID=2527983 RepID=A0A517S9W9_9PLAN|nr:GNAT family N-acetyltransferase [Caulifigura coniformis]QDT52912.1 Acetyltransferase (GNAT) family protein [Caulifigura coniformis]